LIIAPLLIEIREMFNGKVSLFSGRDFNVDATKGLNGYCDYILTASEFTLEIAHPLRMRRGEQAPVITIVEAKNDSTNAGLGQCIAEMVAAQWFNQARDKITESIYGAVTNGRVWRFLQLDDRTVAINREELTVEDADYVKFAKILGILSNTIKILNIFQSL